VAVAAAGVLRIVNGVAALLGLDGGDRLYAHLAEFLPFEPARGAGLKELLPTLRDAVNRTAAELFKVDEWDRRTAPYRYAAAVVAWLYLYAEHYGHYIRRNCPLFSTRVASEVLRFLATGDACCIAEALADELLDVSPHELGDICVRGDQPTTSLKAEDS
jgi:hypothetical protein